MAPQVQDLAQSMAMLEPGYAEQRGLIGEQMEGLGAASQIKRDRLEGAKVDAFNTINNQALGKGVGAAFSGIPIAEQTDYLSREYLPGMQDIELQEGQERMQLRGTLAQLNAQQNTAALSRIDQQTQALNTWNLQQAQIEAQRREAELNRIFQREERAASEAFTARQNAANRAATTPAAPTVDDVINAWGATQYAKVGSDYKKNYSWEDSGIKGQLQAMGISGKDSYAHRKRLLGY